MSFTIARRFLFLSTQRVVVSHQKVVVLVAKRIYRLLPILSSFFSLLFFFSSMFPKKEPGGGGKKWRQKIQNFYVPGKKSAKLHVFSSPSKEHLDDDDHVLPSAHNRRRRQVWHRASGDVFFFVWDDDGPTFGILDDGTHAAWSRVVVVVVVDQRENDFEARRTRANVRVRGEESAERAASGTRTEHGLRSGKCAGEGETHTHTHTEREREREHFVIEKHFDLFFFFLSFWEIFSSSVERERENIVARRLDAHLFVLRTDACIFFSVIRRFFVKHRKKLSNVFSGKSTPLSVKGPS